MTNVLALVATIPARKLLCERMLRELANQTRRPDGVILVLDGYGDAPAPACSPPVAREYRTPALSGAGQRWLRLADCDPEDIICNVDDDAVLLQAPHFIKALVETVERDGGAAAAMGRTTRGRQAPPGALSWGPLVHAAGLGLTVRAKHLAGLQAFAGEVKAKGGPDGLGPGGDDDGLLSAYLWRSGVVIRHAATGNVFQAPGARASSQSAARTARRESFDAQKVLLKKTTGWPWPMA
jgi:hypothetical protein